MFASESVVVSAGNAVTGKDTTTGFHSVARNDLRKVHAVLNEIDGYASTDDTHGYYRYGVPNVFGMNFQAVSVGQKLAVGNGADVRSTADSSAAMPMPAKHAEQRASVRSRFRRPMRWARLSRN